MTRRPSGGSGSARARAWLLGLICIGAVVAAGAGTGGTSLQDDAARDRAVVALVDPATVSRNLGAASAADARAARARTLAASYTAQGQAAARRVSDVEGRLDQAVARVKRVSSSLRRAVAISKKRRTYAAAIAADEILVTVHWANAKVAGLTARLEHARSQQVRAQARAAAATAAARAYEVIAKQHRAAARTAVVTQEAVRDQLASATRSAEASRLAIARAKRTAARSEDDRRAAQRRLARDRRAAAKAAAE